MEGYKFGEHSNSLNHISSIQRFEDRFTNLNVQTKGIQPAEEEEKLNLEMRALPEFDRIVLKACLDKNLINKKAVKQAAYDLASANKPFFNLGSQHGSAMFAPDQSSPRG